MGVLSVSIKYAMGPKLGPVLIHFTGAALYLFFFLEVQAVCLVGPISSHGPLMLEA